MVEQKLGLKNTTICYGISNTFFDNKLRLFFNEYDNYTLQDMNIEIEHLQRMFPIDLYLFESSQKIENHYHLLSFDILTTREFRTIINYCTNDGDYLYNFYDENFEYILRLSEKNGNKIIFKKFYPSPLKNKHIMSEKHYRAYMYATRSKLPIIANKKTQNINTKMVVYTTYKTHHE